MSCQRELWIETYLTVKQWRLLKHFEFAHGKNLISQIAEKKYLQEKKKENSYIIVDVRNFNCKKKNR